MTIRVLLLSYLPPSGTLVKAGVGTVSYALAKSLKELGVEVAVLSGPYSGAVSTFNLEDVLSYTTARPYTLTTPFTLVETRKTFRFEILHSFTAAAFIGSLISRLAFGTPVLAHYQGAPQNPSVIRRDLSPLFQALGPRANADDSLKVSAYYWWLFTRRKLFFRRCDAVVSASNYAGRELIEKYGVSQNRVRIIYNGVDIDHFRHLNIRRAPHRLLYVGRLSLEKGVQYAIQALPLILRVFPDARLVVAGSRRDAYELLFELAKRLMVQDRVDFVGYVSPQNLPHLYNGAGLFVQPALYESLSMTVLEAMACGTPVIASAAGSIGEAVSDGASGFLVRPGSSLELAQKTIDILSKPAGLGQVSEVARRTVLNIFTWKKSAAELLALYEELA